LEAGIARQLILGGRSFLDQSINYVIGRDTIALSGEGNDHAMTQHWATEGLNVLDRHMGSSVQQGTGFATQY
jgi:hypothetical protein